MNPVPYGKWSGVLDATELSPMCLQVPIFIKNLRNQTFGQEDCLYLNVFTPELKPSKPMSVLVYIHGGSLRVGHSGPKESMDYFMDEGVVLVSMEYRVGALGFMSTEDNVIPGNFGFKDQSLAIKWVKENIESFGGDSDSITTFGECAGGISSHFHMASPLTRGLLKGVISESGVMNKIWTFGNIGFNRKNAFKAAEIVGCDNRSSGSILECLQSINPEKIVKSEVEFLYWDYEPMTVFRPCVEPAGEGAFLPEDPFKVRWTLPWIVGFTSAEGALKAASLISQNKTPVREFADNIDEYLMRIMSLDEKAENTAETVRRVREKYFRDMTDEVLYEGIVKLYGDLPYYWPTFDAISKHLGQIFVYYFDYRGGNSLVEKIAPGKDLGVAYGDDLCVIAHNILLINLSEHFPDKKSGDEEMSKTMVKMWSDFAKNQQVEGWPDGKNGDYLHIKSPSPVIGNNLMPDVANFWGSLPSLRT